MQSQHSLEMTMSDKTKELGRNWSRLGNVIIRRMFRTDIPSMMELIREQGWNQLESDWRRFIRLEPTGCFVATLGAKIIATATTERFDAVGWIGMLLVGPEWRGCGLGRAMMRRCIRYLRDQGVHSIKLDATPVGKPLYEKLGFEEEYALQRVIGDARPAAYADVEPYDGRPEVLDAIIALDTSTYHVNRADMIRALTNGWPEMAAVHIGTEGIDGYVLGRHGQNYEQVAPLIALNVRAAEALLCWAMNVAAGKKLAFDRPDSNAVACALARKLGFEPVRSFTRMHLGREPFLDNMRQIYATSGAEKG